MGNKIPKYETKEKMQAVVMKTQVGGLAFVLDKQQLYFRVEKGWQLVEFGEILQIPKDEGDKEKKKKIPEVKKLALKDTQIVDVDKMFTDAADPFNNAVDVKEKLDKTLTQLKELTGHKTDDSIKVIVVNLKKQFPKMTLEIQDGPKLVLRTGCEEDNQIDLSQKVVKSFDAISDLLTKLVDLMKKAVDSAESIIKKSDELSNTLENAGLNPFQLSKALFHAAHNFLEFKKVPPIGAALKETIEGIVEEVKEAKRALDNPEQEDTEAEEQEREEEEADDN